MKRPADNFGTLAFFVGVLVVLGGCMYFIVMR